MFTAQAARVFRFGGQQILVPHYFNIEKNLEYVGPIHDISFYGFDDLSGGEMKEFVAWYVSRNSDLLDNKRALVS